MIEGDFQRETLNTIGADPRFRLFRQLNGQFYWRDEKGEYHPVRLGPPKGAADLTGYVWGRGTRIELEMKGPETRTTPEQIAWGKACRAAGVIHHIARYDRSKTMAENVAMAMAEIERQAGV